METLDEISNIETSTVDFLEDEIELESFSIDYTYPSVLLSGVQTEWELEYLSKYTCREDASLPLYVEFEGIIANVGNIELTSSYFITLTTLTKDNPYNIKLLLNAKEEKVIKYNEPEELVKFIKL